MVIPDKPMRYLVSDTEFWQILENASDYVNYNTIKSRTGNYIENLFAYTHVDHIPGISDIIYAYIGTEDGDTGVYYDWRTHANVHFALESVSKYSDFYDVLKQVGYDQRNVVTVTAVEQLQIFVNEAREDAGLTPGS